MTWQDIKDALNELPDSIVTALSGELRTDLAFAGRDPGLPEHAIDYRRTAASSSAWNNPTGAIDLRIQRYILAYRDLRLGWRIARQCYLKKVPIPSCLAWSCEYVFRAFLYQVDPKAYCDDDLCEALAWETPAMRGTAVKIRACLTSRDATLEEVAKYLKLNVEALRIYDALFYNVSGRKEDGLWLSNIVYPNGRMVEFFENYANQADLDMLLTRAGFKNGIEHVLQLAGVSADPMDILDSSVSAQQLEAFLMAQGLLMAQNGWVNNQTNATAMFHARHLMTAAKMGGEDTTVGNEYMGLGDTLWSEMQAAKKPQAEAALRLQNRARIIEGVEVITETGDVPLN